MTDLNKPGGRGPNDPKLGMDELVTDREKELKGTLKEHKAEGFKKRIDVISGNTEAIIKDLKENHVKIEEDVEYLGYKGKKVHIDLPAVGNFEGFKFEYFVSDDHVTKGVLKKKPELKKRLYSMRDISELLESINKYMAELHIENDGDMDYYNELQYRLTGKYRCNAGDYLKFITGLDFGYWLSDEGISWCFHNDNCYFNHFWGDYNLNSLFLKLSD